MNDQPPTAPAVRPATWTRRRVAATFTHRAATDSAPRRIEMFIPYDQEVRLWWFREVIRFGFFARAIREAHDVVAWYAHGEGGQLPFGRTPDTLALRETREGLYATAQPPDRPWVDDLAAAIERREIRGASFAFDLPRDEKGRSLGDRWIENPGEDPLRELVDGLISDISPVVHPAYTASDTDIRAQAEKAFTEFRSTHPTPAQVAPAGDTNPGQPAQVDELTHRSLSLRVLGSVHRLP